jgi:hypothetical protein
MLALVHATRAAAAATCGTENLLAGKMREASETRNDLARLTDGVVGREGAPWNAPVVVVLTTPVSFVTFDLGEPREISTLYLQADANDVYRVSGSLDGSPAHFRPIAAFPNVIEKGHGLRDRAIEMSPTTVRYLRVGEPTGDSYFSIAEVGAYCRKPSPFPPRLRADESPEQQSPAAEPNGRWPAFVARYGMALAALGWLVHLMSGRRHGAGAHGRRQRTRRR